MSESEITALREKLAAAEASLAERGRMLETTHRVQRSYRAAVATALAELRAKLDVIRFFEQHKTQDDAMQAVTQCVDAVIAKLDLPEAAPASCTWTLDDDGNYATGCDGLFVVLKDSLAGYQMASCCFCGRPIKEQQ